MSGWSVRARAGVAVATKGHARAAGRASVYDDADIAAMRRE
jgi:hypothetical protein